MALAQKFCGSARGKDRLFDRKRVIGAIGINLPRRIWNNRGGNRDIGLIGRSGCDLTDDPAVLVGGNMGLKAMRQRVRCFTQAASLSPLLAEPITVAS